jgi:hypothetical protein
MPIIRRMIHTLKRDRRRCWRCGLVKKLAGNFYRLKSDRLGFARKCKPCHKQDDRKFKLKATYGISLADYHLMFTNQGGKCAICRKQGTRTRRKVFGKVDGLAVDHCHVTGKVRGLLCLVCNMGIGAFSDSAACLRDAAAYLERGR